MTIENIQLKIYMIMDKPMFTLQKLVKRGEANFIAKCRAIISELTGEEFIIARPAWLTFANMQLESDGFCENLKMAIDFQPTHMYTLPAELKHLYESADDFARFLAYVDEARFICNCAAGIAGIPIPHLMDDETLRNHLRNKLHELTKFRVWVGSPRCTLPTYARESEAEKNKLFEQYFTTIWCRDYNCCRS